MADPPEPVVILSALTIVACFLLLFRFITRLGIIEAQGVLQPATGGRREVPSRPMVGVQNPFTLSLLDSHINYTSSEKGLVKLVLSSTVACYVTVYWGVKKEALDSALNEQEELEFNGNSEDSDSESEELQHNKAIPLGHILAGSYMDRGPSEFYESSSEILIEVEVPTGFQNIIKESTTNARLVVYPMIVTMEASNGANNRYSQPFDIVALLGAFLVSSLETQKLEEVSQYVQTADGKMFTVKKLFLTEEEAASEHVSGEELNTQHHPSTSNNPNNSDFSNSVCVICRSLPVTCALLPCRHACVCGTCFKQISSCPMCRGPIHSFFTVQDEPYGADYTEPNASDDLNRMSAWEIFRGIFSAG